MTFNDNTLGYSCNKCDKFLSYEAKLGAKLRIEDKLYKEREQYFDKIGLPEERRTYALYQTSDTLEYALRPNSCQAEAAIKGLFL